MPNRKNTVVALIGTAFASAALTGCPLSDRYYVEQNQSGKAGESSTEGGAHQGGTSSRTASSGAAGSDGGVTSGDSQSGSSATTLASTCDASNCDKTCCGQLCMDLSTDSSNCGSCGNSCLAGRSCRAKTCVGWTTMAPPPSTFAGRQKFASTEMGGKWFIFGGLDASGNVLSDGAIYDPSNDSWTLLPAATGSPSGRQLASAVWTGLRVLVVGGTDAASSRAFADGAKYDPATDSWIAMPDLPVGRIEPFLVNLSAGQGVLSWGGYGSTGMPLSGGERYGYNATSFTAIASGFGAPGRQSDATFAAASSQAYLFGGLTDGTTKSSSGYSLGVGNFQWMALTKTAGPVARYAAFGAWDGSAFYVWGGRDELSTFGDGSRYSNGAWTPMSNSLAPAARYAPHRRAGFAFSDSPGSLIVLGGVDGNGTLLTDGGRYVASTASWSKIDNWPSGASHEFGAATVIGGEVLVWGGRDGSLLTTNGERYLP